ncbi:MAG: hypothetical protein ACK5P7_00660 [Bdellovibrio sp.]|jgi:hypothetical protein
MKKMILTAVITMAASTAFGKASTEYYFQPAAGAQAVELQYSMNADPIKTESGSTETDAGVTTADFNLNYAYGLTETAAIGVYTFTGSEKTKSGSSDSSASGMGDLHVYYKGFSDMIHWGADLGINMGKSKSNAAGETTNRSSGGLSLKANVGVLMNASEWNYGGDLSITLPQERTADANGTDIKTTGGNVTKLAGFAEYNYGMGFVGGELAYIMVGDTTRKTTPEEKRKGEGFLQLTGNASYDFNDMATGLLSIGLEQHSSRDLTDSAGSAKVKAYMGTNVALGVRLNF